MTDLQVRIFDTAAGVVEYCAAAFQETVVGKRGGRAAVALSGGSTPRRIYEELARRNAALIPWQKVELFFGDERAVPPDDSDSNYALARDCLLAHVPLAPERVHRMEAESEDLDQAARRYEECLREHVEQAASGIPRFDLIWLGMGEDGHTASLFPATAALDESERLVCANEVPQLRAWRMTFTYALINAARRVQIIVTGERKASRIRQIMAGSDPAAPAARVQPLDGLLEWVLDSSAAGETRVS